MPVYPGPANGLSWTGPYLPPTQQLPVGDLPYSLFSAETRAAGIASLAVQLGKKDEDHAGSVSIEGNFSGDPGGFELDLQTADTDADGLYQQEGLGIVANSGAPNFAFRAEFLNVSANFGRLLIKTLTNAVKITARMTYR